mgnify:CR=1 FL=1
MATLALKAKLEHLNFSVTNIRGFKWSYGARFLNSRTPPCALLHIGQIQLVRTNSSLNIALFICPRFPSPSHKPQHKCMHTLSFHRDSAAAYTHYMDMTKVCADLSRVL